MSEATSTTPKTERFHLERGLRSRKFRASEVGLCEMTLARAMKAGRLGFIRVGDRILVSDSHMEDWLASLEQRADKARGKAA